MIIWFEWIYCTHFCDFCYFTLSVDKFSLEHFYWMPEDIRTSNYNLDNFPFLKIILLFFLEIMLPQILQICKIMRLSALSRGILGAFVSIQFHQAQFYIVRSSIITQYESCFDSLGGSSEFLFCFVLLWCPIHFHLNQFYALNLIKNFIVTVFMLY